MKATVLVSSVLSLAAAGASAEPPDSPPTGHRPPIERLASDLGLDESQKGEVERILEAQHAKMLAAREEAEASGVRPSHEEMHKRREQMQQETLEQLKPVLTEEQLQKFQSLMKERRRGPHGPPPDESAPVEN